MCRSSAVAAVRRALLTGELALTGCTLWRLRSCSSAFSCATAPNQVWTWDITKLLGPHKWTYFHLYVILDLFSRYVVGWMIATRESATLAQCLLRETCKRQEIEHDALTLHQDRGSPMTSKTFAQTCADLGVDQASRGLACRTITLSPSRNSRR
jgi:transposase InsO family protein